MKAALLSSMIVAALASASALASNVVVSNLTSPETAGAALTAANGSPLAAGSLVRLGTFPGLDLTQIAALAEQGPSALVDALTPFGPAFPVGTGASGSAGSIEFTASQELAAQGGSLYAVILNAANVETATEALVLKLSETLPADDASGLPAYLAVHLRDAELVFGSSSTAGFASKASGSVPEGFETWIASQLGSGALPADLLAEADPDQDGASNLVEYAFGSGAADGASITKLEIHRSGEQFFVRYLRRVGDSGLRIRCETESQLDVETWPTLDTPVTVLEDPAPAGYERVQQPLPATEGLIFARLRATRTTE